MSLLIVGSVAIDSIDTPWGGAKEVLGGSATYAGFATRFWTKPELVGVVGSDFPKKYQNLMAKHGLSGEGLTQRPGHTFRWEGEYDANFHPTTHFLDLGVFADFSPELTPRLQKSRHAFLGNIHPILQEQVLKQLKAPRLTGCDSRDDWIKTEKKRFLKLLKSMDLLYLNDHEARLLTGEHSLIKTTRILARLGPKVAIVKKGEHGVLAASRDTFFSLPASPVEAVIDPTGAGDSFAGASMGYLSRQRRITWNALCKSLEFASVVATMTIDAFGPDKLVKASKEKILDKVKQYRASSQSLILG